MAVVDMAASLLAGLITLDPDGKLTPRRYAPEEVILEGEEDGGKEDHGGGVAERAGSVVRVGKAWRNGSDSPCRTRRSTRLYHSSMP
jgi:hypothetical protein